MCAFFDHIKPRDKFASLKTQRRTLGILIKHTNNYSSFSILNMQRNKTYVFRTKTLNETEEAKIQQANKYSHIVLLIICYNDMINEIILVQ